MTDIKPYAAEILKDFGNVELSFNRSFQALPVIVITETENTAQAVINTADLISRIVIQVDCYGENVKKTEEMAVKISNALTGAGFRRIFAESIYDEDKPRKCMRFRCGIDETAGRILSLD